MSPSLDRTSPGAIRFKSPFEGDQRLLISIPEAIQQLHLFDALDAMEVEESRSLIAPPMTSLEGAMVISHVGTTSMEAVSERNTREERRTQTLVLSDTRKGE